MRLIIINTRPICLPERFALTAPRPTIQERSNRHYILDYLRKVMKSIQ